MLRSVKTLQGVGLTINLPPIIHIVRRFGCVGGMESYVWNLTHELIKQDVQVEIICEETLANLIRESQSIGSQNRTRGLDGNRWDGLGN